MDQSAINQEKDTVFIIDQDQAAQNRLAALVQSMGHEHECYSSPEEYLASFVLGRAGCVVTDYRMMDMSGIELLEALSEKGSAMAVILFTANGSISMAVKAIQSGAMTFLEKSCSENDLWLAIRDAIQNNHARLDRTREWEQIRRALVSLTVVERSVLEMVVNGDGNKQIANKLELGLRTVEERRAKIKKKLGVQSLAELVGFYTHACSFEKFTEHCQSGTAG